MYCMVIFKDFINYYYYYLVESLYSKGQDNFEISEDFSEILRGLNLNKGIKRKSIYFILVTLIIIAFFYFIDD